MRFSLLFATLFLASSVLAQNVVNPNFSGNPTSTTNSQALYREIAQSQNHNIQLQKMLTEHHAFIKEVQTTLSGPGAEQAATLIKQGGPYPTSKPKEAPKTESHNAKQPPQPQ